ncbi:hypothetical protein H483_0112370 [Dietzia sp. UCD-THP]|uniref:hypothetical protein n=1 Tax=Dietzia sp. UCD-THP TaxID=1292020 RepID=UPI0003700C64|nr:hypothetical protein [Dietzia sp. UCD-THP]EYT61787.1 hypothetical protein H483_0112370 [Dietzia sp. UCD-THP]
MTSRDQDGDGEDARARLIRRVDDLCTGKASTSRGELSDRAALLIACGLVEPRIAGIVLARLHRNLPFPTIGGFHQLRVIEEQRHDLRRQLGTPLPSVLRMALRTRLAELDRKYVSLRTGFTRGAGVFAYRIKDIRADRKRGVHLDPEDRGRLFDALASTPTMAPVPMVPRTMVELGTAAAAYGQREMGRVVLPHRVQAVVDSLPSLPRIRADSRRLPEMYTALLMDAGGMYDRLIRAYVRGGRSVEEIRLQFDAETELMGLAGDLCRLRETASTPGFSTARDGFTLLTGMGAAIDEVWAEVVERAVAFRELVESVENRAEAAVSEAARLNDIARENGVRPPSTVHAPSPADLTAEHLAARAGDRMLSTEAMRRLRGQIDPNR